MNDKVELFFTDTRIFHKNYFRLLFYFVKNFYLNNFEDF